ncbi:MAG: hypothetical protein ACRENI_03845 [Gemmatimonadaceae bacterium]
MNRRRIVPVPDLALVAGTALLMLVAPVIAAQAQVPHDSVARELARLRRQVDSLRRVAERHDERLMELDERGVAGARVPGTGAPADTGRRTLPSAQGIYGKPFVRRGGGAAIGGYFDTEYINNIDRRTSEFDQHRLIPFIFAEITDRLHFGTEIEFEHGGNVDEGGEVKVEFATFDYAISDALNIRGGIILAPLGRFNLVHDSPVNDLTDRPLVTREILPTTLSEAGLGIFGTVYPSAQTLLSYELYVVNGFDDEILAPGGGGGGVRVRSGRGQLGGDNNDAKSLVGRLAFSPFLGLELAASAHTGRYAPQGVAGFDGDERLTILAADATFQRGALELLGEYGRVAVDLPPGTVGVADSQDGYYVQGNYHFGYGLLPPSTSSVFTGVVRWDQVDFARGDDGDLNQRLTVGLNWRPVEEAVFKTGFQWNWATPPGTTSRGDADRRFLASMATYF